MRIEDSPLYVTGHLSPRGQVRRTPSKSAGDDAAAKARSEFVRPDKPPEKIRKTEAEIWRW